MKGAAVSAVVGCGGASGGRKGIIATTINISARDINDTPTNSIKDPSVDFLFYFIPPAVGQTKKKDEAPCIACSLASSGLCKLI